MRCAAVLIKLPRITILPYLLSHMKACSKRQTYPRIKGVRGDGCHSVSVKRVPSRFGPVDKSKNSAETHSGSSRTVNLGIAKDGIYHPLEV